MRFKTLQEWLSWQETLHPSEIELGLDRVYQVLTRLELTHPSFTVVTVAGTNGKGSSVAMLQSILLEAGIKVGSYTSPHLLKYNERIQVNGQPVNDETLCQSFERVDQARCSGLEEISLTYFEFGTLAAIDIFHRAGVDIALLEVGLGGRLDAVNVLDADVALITAIDIDHQDWLGNDRESIALEKAGIMRPDRPVICSDPDVPESLLSHASETGARLYLIGRDFMARSSKDHWYWQGVKGREFSLPLPALPGECQVTNAAGVLATIEQLSGKLPRQVQLDEEVCKRGLVNTSLLGRFQIIRGRPTQILDVAHNPQAARGLADRLSDLPCQGKTRAVLAMLADKDIPAVVSQMRDSIDQWYLASLHVPRGAKASDLQAALSDQPTQVFDDPGSAYRAAINESAEQDRVVIFGSFYTVAAALSQAV